MRAIDAVLGVDLGTSNVKALIVSLDGEVLGHAVHPVPMHRPEPGAAEQDPDEWWAAVVAAVGEAVARAHAAGGVAARDVVAIGLTGQMHGAVLVDDAGRAIHRCITWADTRPAALVGRSEGSFAARVTALTGSTPAAGATALSVQWLSERDPAMVRRATALLLPKDALRLRLTGERATDPSDASGTLLFDVSRRAWSDELAAAFRIPRAVLPPLRESRDVAGPLLAPAAARLGLRTGIPVVTGAADAATAALAVGAVPRSARVTPERPSIGSVGLGTAAQLVVGTEGPTIEPAGRVHAMAHALPDAWYAMAAILSAGAAVEWVAGLLFGDRDAARRVAAFDAAAAQAPPGARGALFAPYLRGEGSPHLDGVVRGAFAGLDIGHGRAELARATYEGVAFALLDGARVMRGLGVAPSRIVLSGGGAASETWSRIIAGVVGLPVERRQDGAGSAYGAAMLAAMGIGARAAAVLAWADRSSGSAIMASSRELEAYAAAGERFRALYPALRTIH